MYACTYVYVHAYMRLYVHTDIRKQGIPLCILCVCTCVYVAHVPTYECEYAMIHLQLRTYVCHCGSIGTSVLSDVTVY